MGSGVSSAPSHPKIKFINGKPTFNFTEAVQCFQTGNGLFFRLVNSETKEWAIYNDTKEYEAHIAIIFKEGSRITPIGKTEVEAVHEDEDFEIGKECVAYLSVLPLSTERFIKGDVNGFESRVAAELIELPDPVFITAPPRSQSSR